MIAHTVREGSFGDLQFLIAVRSTYASALCTITVDTTFHDATGAEIGHADAFIEGPPHRGSSGTGSLMNCLSPGQIGMAATMMTLTAGTVDDIASTTWTAGALNVFDALPTSDLSVTDVTAVDDGSGSKQFRGTFRNFSSATVTYPEVTLFGLNAVGRPLFEGSDIDSGSVPPSGSWSFLTIPRFTETYADYAAFPRAND